MDYGKRSEVNDKRPEVNDNGGRSKTKVVHQRPEIESVIAAADVGGSKLRPHANGKRPEVDCDRLKGLTKRQREICRGNVDVVAVAKTGTGNVVEECQFQFRNRRWNCSTLNTAMVYGKTLFAGRC